VPITFAVVDGTIVTAVDHKPKRTRALRRLENVERDPRVTVLVDHWSADWTELWWVRIAGRAEVVTSGDRFDRAVDALVARYPQYQEHRPDGPAIVIAPSTVRSWSSRP
jgi:PPOX class probable F420-dependent enzyme